MEIKIKAFLRCVQSDSESSSKNGDVRNSANTIVRWLFGCQQSWRGLRLENLSRDENLPHGGVDDSRRCLSPSIVILRFTFGKLRVPKMPADQIKDYDIIFESRIKGRTMTNAAQKVLLWNLIPEIKQFISPFLCSLCGWTFAHIQIVACLLTTRGLNLNNVINTGDVFPTDCSFTPPGFRMSLQFLMHLSRVGAEGQDRADKFDNLMHDHFDPITVNSCTQWHRCGDDDGEEELEHLQKYLRLHHRAALDRYLMPPEINFITRRPPVPIQHSRELLHHRFAFVFCEFSALRLSCVGAVAWTIHSNCFAIS